MSSSPIGSWFIIKKLVSETVFYLCNQTANMHCLWKCTEMLVSLYNAKTLLNTQTNPVQCNRFFLADRINSFTLNDLLLERRNIVISLVKLTCTHLSL